MANLFDKDTSERIEARRLRSFIECGRNEDRAGFLQHPSHEFTPANPASRDNQDNPI